VNGDEVTIRNVRDSELPGIDQMNVRWIDETLDAGEITNLWVYFGHFGRFRGIAHSELGFEFADRRCLTASFEVRPLVGEHYGIIDGFKPKFELTLRWTTERDALLRRFLRSNIDTRMYLFEAAITHQRTVELFHAAARRTNELHETPEWYHTARNSCTTNLVQLVDEVLPGQLRKTPRVLLPGLLPSYWSKRGVLKLNGTFEETLATSLLNDRAAAIGYVPDFSARLHNRIP